MANELPVWMDRGVEPPESLKISGWQPGMKPSAQHMNWLFNRSYMVLKELQENGGIAELQAQFAAHLDEIMPHKFLDNGKWYRWGFRTVDGEPEFIYEEVV